MEKDLRVSSESILGKAYRRLSPLPVGRRAGEGVSCFVTRVCWNPYEGDGPLGVWEISKQSASGSRDAPLRKLPTASFESDIIVSTVESSMASAIAASSTSADFCTITVATLTPIRSALVDTMLKAF